MLKLLKLIAYRIHHNKVYLMLYLVLIPLVIGIAVYVTNHVSYQMQIGIVGDINVVENDSVNYLYLEDVPDISKMVLNQYDAVLVETNQNVEVFSTKGDEFNQAVQLLVFGQLNAVPNNNTQRGVASNILGFLMMVVSLLGVQIYQYYFDERTGINKRILSTSIHCYQYMLSHFIVVFAFLTIPATAVICGAIWIFNITLSIPLWQLVLMLIMLCFFATSFGLWINALSKTVEESMMFGNMFAIVGSIISGGFVQVTDNEIFNYFAQVLPQKQIISTISALESNTTIPFLGICYVLAISIILIVFAIIIEKRKLPIR